MQEKKQCYKIKYESEEKAISNIGLLNIPDKTKKYKARAYKCNICGEWHLTIGDDWKKKYTKKIKEYGIIINEQNKKIHDLRNEIYFLESQFYIRKGRTQDFNNLINTEK